MDKNSDTKKRKRGEQNYGVVDWPDAKGPKPQVSNLGRVKQPNGHAFTPKPAKSGYSSAYFNGKGYYVHVLVCRAFNGPPPSAKERTVNHIQRDKDKIEYWNSANNLEWATQKDQNNHSYRENKKRKSNAPRQSKPVESQKIGEEDWTRHVSANEAARTLGLESGNVSKVCRGRNKQTGGFIFRYAEQPTLECGEWLPVVFGNGPGEVPTTQIKPGLQVPEVSNLGYFKSSKGVITMPAAKQSGYCRVKVFGRSYLIHRLICRAFLGPPPDDEHHTVDHINSEEKSNNRVSNLRWATWSDQARNQNRQPNQKENQSIPLRPVSLRGTAWTGFPSGLAVYFGCALDLTMLPTEGLKRGCLTFPPN